MMCDFSKYIVRDTVTIREALIALNRLSDDVLVLFVVDSGNCLVGTLTGRKISGRKLIEGVGISSR